MDKEKHNFNITLTFDRDVGSKFIAGAMRELLDGITFVGEKSGFETNVIKVIVKPTGDK